MTLENAAKMLIVGWIKNWTMHTLLDAIDGKSIERYIEQPRIDALVKEFPFMPSKRNWYYLAGNKGAYVRKFVHDTYPKLSNALWDTEDNMKKLAFHTYVMSVKAGAIEPGKKYSRADYLEKLSDTRKYRQSVMSEVVSRDIFVKASGHDWNTVK